MNKIEMRCELRADLRDRHISGKAISFETKSNDLGFYEIIHRESITQKLIDSSNIVFTYNHQRDRILARRNRGKGTLEIFLRDDGVYFDFPCPDTNLGRDLMEDICVGNISQCSFAFTIPDEEGAQKWVKSGDSYERHIYRIGEIFDLSAVVDPAYDDTYIQARSVEFTKIKDELDKVQVQEPEPETEQRDDECIDIQENPETPTPEDVVVEVQEENTENQNEKKINNIEKAEENPQPEANE